MEKLKPRLSNIELLRIVAMALIIASHLSSWGGAYYHTEGVDKFVASLFVTGGRLGVSLFVMIGSIFMTKRNMSFTAVFRIVLAMMLVDFIFTSLCAVMGRPFSIVSTFIPITKYWFVNVYVGLMLVSPWLNKLIVFMDYRAYRNLCVILTFFCAILPALTFNGDFTNQFLWFVYLYFLVNFLVKYEMHITSGCVWKKFRCVISRTYFLLIVGGYAFMAYLVYLNETYFPLRNSGYVIMLIVAICIFMFFYKLDIGYSAFINWIAKGTFVAYLIHDNGKFKPILWENILKCDQWYNSPNFILYGIFSIMGILLIGAIITIVIDKLVLCILNISVVKRIVSKFDSVYQMN